MRIARVTSQLQANTIIVTSSYSPRGLELTKTAQAKGTLLLVWRKNCATV
jgi:hypothetical protein